jgi:hypothetical protein
MNSTNIKFWSFSSWHTWHQCAFRWYHVYVLGMKEPPGPAMARGDMIHKKAEAYLKGELKGPVPKELAKLGSYYEQLRRQHPLVEEYWNVNSKWKQATKDRMWCTMKMDAALLPGRKARSLLIQDTKTGHEYDYHAKQASLYACLGAAIVPETVGVDVEMWYVDEGYPISYRFTPAQIERQTNWWMGQGERLLADRKWLATPSVEACKYCHIRSDRGGTCKSWKVLMLGR